MASKSCYVCCFTFLLTFSSIIRVHGIFLQTVYNTNTSNGTSNFSVAVSQKSTNPVLLSEPVEETNFPVGMKILIAAIAVLFIAFILIFPFRCCRRIRYCCEDDYVCDEQCFNGICCCNLYDIAINERPRNSFSRDPVRMPITRGLQQPTQDVAGRIEQYLGQMIERLENQGPTLSSSTISAFVPPSASAPPSASVASSASVPTSAPGQTPPPSYSAAVRDGMDGWKYPPVQAPKEHLSTNRNLDSITEMSAISSENFSESGSGSDGGSVPFALPN